MGIPNSPRAPFYTDGERRATRETVYTDGERRATRETALLHCTT